MESFDRLLRALGLVVFNSSKLDQSLRQVYVALVGEKEASVKAGGQMTDTLIKWCVDLVNGRDMEGRESLGPLLTLLVEAAAVNRRRNRFVHDLWVIDVDGLSFQMQSVKKS